MGKAVPDNKGNISWLCKCTCGRIGIVRQYSLGKDSNRCSYCGSRMTPKGHGMKGHTLYNIWCDMHQRCTNPKLFGYRYWGGRGIKVCEEWESNFMVFCQWAIANGWKKGLTIDRIDNDGNYEPENCRFATYTQQARNTRRGRFETINGITKHIFDWAEECNIPTPTMSSRYVKGWRGLKLLSPINIKKRNHLYPGESGVAI